MKTQNPLIGRSRKSYGDATFYTLNGENIVRTKPMVVSNPNTPAQEAQRVRFKAFTEAANSLPEADLNLLFATKVTGRNRRSMLQAQLAPAYGAQPTSDPSLKERFEPTFDITKISDIGSGAVGFIGDLVECALSGGIIQINNTRFTTLKDGMVDYNENDRMIVVAIAEDGCVIRCIDTEKTFGEVEVETAEGGISEINGLAFDGHGSAVYCYAVGGKLQLIGLGTFSVAERPARKGHNPKHNTPV